MKIQLLLTFIALSPLALCQYTGVRPYTPIPVTSDEQRRGLLRQDPALLEFAARVNERILIEVDGPDSVALVQENVNVNMDCLPWLRRFTGGEIQWFMQLRDISGEPIGETIAFDPEQRGYTIRIGGEYNRWFNVTGTIIMVGAEDPSFGDYICSVCVDRGTPSQECHNATTTLHILGAPPVLEKPVDNEPVLILDAEVYRIGANFCINANENRNIVLVYEIKIYNTPSAVPEPIRTWTKDGHTIYSQLAGDRNTPEINKTFLMQGRNVVFMPGLIIPQPLNPTRFGELGIRLSAQGEGNITMEMPHIGLTRETFAGVVFEEILGVYTCSVSNVYGQDTAQTTIRECGVLTAPGLAVSAGNDSTSLHFTISPSTPPEDVRSYTIVAVGAKSNRSISVPIREVEGSVVTAGGFEPGLYIFYVCPVGPRGRLGPCSDSVAYRIQPPLSLRLINSSPRMHGGDISVEFIPSRSLKSAQCSIIDVLNLNRSTVDCSSGRVRFQGMSSGLYRLRIIARDSTGERVVERRTLFVCDEEEGSCGVNLINEGVTVEGDCATIQFTSCGRVDSFMCRLNRDPFKPCRSPLRLCGLEASEHRLLILPSGGQCLEKGRLVAKFEVA